MSNSATDDDLPAQAEPTLRTSVAAIKSSAITTTKRRPELLVLLPLIGYCGFFAYRRMINVSISSGDLFGWFIGASLSPVASVAAPLVFGMLATIVLATLFRVLKSLKKATVMRLFVHVAVAWAVMHLTAAFIHGTWTGIDRGTQSMMKFRAEAAAEQRAHEVTLAKITAGQLSE